MKNRRKKSLILKITVFVLFLVLLVGAEVIYLWQQQFYASHFFPGTRINGMDVGGLTVGEVEKLLDGSIDAYSLTLTFRDGEQETLSGDSMGYARIPNQEVLELMGAQEPSWWFLHMTDTTDHKVTVTTGFSYEELAETVYSLPELQADRIKEPVDAALSWDGSRFVITPEDDGYKPDPAVIYEAVYEAARSKAAALDVTAVEGAYTLAAVRSDDALLQRQAEQLDSLLPKTVITYNLPSGQEVLDGKVMEKWLAKDAEGNYSLDEKTWDEGISAWLADFADRVDTVGKERTFESAHAGTVTLSGTSDYGWAIDRRAEFEWLKEAVRSGETMNRQPVWAKQELAGMDDHSGLGGSFIEADLTAQHLWVYQDGEVILESDLVSGVMTEYSHTPDGVWILDYKETDTTLLGDINEEGVYGYAEYVYYWMRLNDEGIGLHDATWREYFGGDIYIDYGSHGCLNLPLDVAMQIYNYIDETTPVIIYYAEPYELHE